MKRSLTCSLRAKPGKLFFNAENRLSIPTIYKCVCLKLFDIPEAPLTDVEK